MRLRGRISIVGAASAAGVIALAIAPAAGVAKSKSKSSSNLVKCTATLATEIPTGQDQPLLNPTPGKQWGAIRCAKGVGSGLEEFSYKIPDSGDEVGAFVAYFKGGTIKGKFDLIGQEGIAGNGVTSSFGYEAFAGALTHLSGTGAFASAKGAGTASCTSQDSLHFKCVEKL